jgi:hypothetical protein
MSSANMDQSDSGGVGAKKGFLYQDYAAAYYLLKMLRDKTLLSVRCEVTDDIDVIYEDYIEYIQVKTTDSDKKWSTTEFTESSVKIVPPTGKQRKPQKISKEDSILHKSLACDANLQSSRFRILSPRDVQNSLNYLKINFSIRLEKSGRDKLLTTLKRVLKEYKSSKGNDVEYWLDNAIWEVIPSITQLELESTKMIMQAAQDRGYFLNANRDCESILDSVLKTLTKKSAISRVLNSTSDKSYARQEFLRWFNEELEYYTQNSSSYVKIYTKSGSELQSILKEFTSHNDIYSTQNFAGEKKCTGLEGKYQMQLYSYDQIAKSLQKWLPEVLLRPNELADTSPSNFDDKIKAYTKRIKGSLGSLNDLVSHILLHSVIRTTSASQPIPAHLYIDDGNDTCHENIHIVINDHSADELWMGFSYFIQSNLQAETLNIVNTFHDLLCSDAFEAKKLKILDVKQDNYLIKHDIDELLQSTASLDEHIERFRFVFFLGYESDALERDMKEMTVDYKQALIEEVQMNFKMLIDELILKNNFMKNLHVDVYLYPIPSLDSLMDEVKLKFEEY